ncbi:hypothetical protein H4R20_002429 [Coemansia guatemalensis]|uniref:Uncharacterized protein n=1 Tax=Coemansia guatemalensis TaxID=2761395 RepID=A0A9W8I2H9_9FUNG|nr:hypothetical protein H4R20_002429 [Coemansia guatemalensis]
MKFLTLSLAIAPVSMGALFSSKPASEASQLSHALLDGFDSSLHSASVQCQGNCQGGEESSPSVAPQDNGSPSSGLLSGLVRNFLQPKENAPAVADKASASATAESNHIVVDSTPVFELLYNYINAASASRQAEAPAYLQSTAAIETEAAPETASTGAINRLVAAFMDAGQPDSVATSTAENWMMAAEETPSASLAAAYAEDSIAPTAFAAQTEADVPNAEYGFDFNSWGSRVDSAAHRLVTNVEGIIVHFLPTVSPQTSLATAADLEETAARFEDSFTAATNMIQDNDEQAESGSLTHWFDYI